MRITAVAGWLTLSVMLVAIGPVRAVSQAPFQIRELVAAPGQTTTGQLDVAAGADAATFIPVSIVHGARPGPVLALIAGVHGSETTPILALQQLLPRLDARALAGTVMLVHVANMPSFLGRTIYTGPIDGKNLNRSFPGRAEGTVSERIAHTLSSEIMRRADVVIDLHSGDANEDLTPWTGFYARHGAADVILRSRALAVAFGLPFIVEFPFEPKTPADVIYTGAAAVQMGKPSFDVEVGRLGLIEPRNIELVVSGSLSVMRYLKMLPGDPAPAPEPWFITVRDNLASEHDGIVYPVVSAGAYVTAGQRLAYITDFHGRRVQEIIAKRAGAVLVLVTTPAIRKGETVAVVGVTSTEP